MIFRFSSNFVIDTSKEPFNREGLRVTMLGGPGSGKSYNNCLFAEQFLTQHGTIVAFQPRDEYYTLKEKFDVVCVGGVHAKDIDFALTKPKMYAKYVVEDGISMIFYTADKDEEKLVQWTSRFIEHVLTFQETHHRPLLIILEEAQEYVPKSAAGHTAPPWVFNRMIRTFTKCFTEGRKLNVIAIASSQRPQQLDFTVRQLANVKFFGKFSSQDIKYVDKECLAIIRQEGVEVEASRLLHLKKGEWLVDCETATDYSMVTHPRLTKHGAETPKLEYIAPRTNETKKTVSDLAAAIKEALEKEAAEQSELEKAKRKIRDLEKKLEAAEEKARIKLSVKDMLKGDGDAEELAEKLAKAETEINHLKDEKSNLEKQHGKVVELISDLREKLAAFEYFEEALLGVLQPRLVKLLKIVKQAPGFEPGTASQGRGVSSEVVELQPTITVVDVQPVMKPVTIDDATTPGKILTVARKGVLNEWRRLGHIVKAILEEGWTVSPQQVNNALNDMVKQQLIAKKHTDRNYFMLAKNVVFEEASS